MAGSYFNIGDTLREPLQQNRKVKKGQSWYAWLSDEKKAAYLEKLWITLQQNKAATLSTNVLALANPAHCRDRAGAMI
jgi:hypothetical protein